jgi:hypothetical protein
MESIPSTPVAAGQATKPASSSATAPTPPAKKRKLFGRSSGNGKPERNVEGLLDRPKFSSSQMIVLQTQLQVAADVSGLPACINRVSEMFLSALRTEEERNNFKLCHIIAFCYDLWLVVDRQATNRFGMGSTTGERNLVRLQDVTSSFVEAFSSQTLENGLKLSTDDAYLVPRIKEIIIAAWGRMPNSFRARDLDMDNLSLGEFPFGDVLAEWEVLTSKASRPAGNLASWRIPDVKSDFSLLAHGVCQVDNARWKSCGHSGLPQRLEKVCLALRLIIYDELGPASFIPRTINETDRKSAAARCGVYSGIVLTRDLALFELMTGQAPISKV